MNMDDAPKTDHVNSGIHAQPKCTCWLGRPGATRGSSAEREACVYHGLYAAIRRLNVDLEVERAKVAELRESLAEWKADFESFSGHHEATERQVVRLQSQLDDAQAINRLKGKIDAVPRAVDRTTWFGRHYDLGHGITRRDRYDECSCGATFWPGDPVLRAAGEATQPPGDRPASARALVQGWIAEDATLPPDDVHVDRQRPELLKVAIAALVDQLEGDLKSRDQYDDESEA